MRDRKRLLPRKAKGRSAITNGKTFLLGVDGRSRSARRFRDLGRGYMAEPDGRHEELCKQAASLVLQRELLDAASVAGERVDTLQLVRLCGAINRTLAKLQQVTADPDAERRRRAREDREAGLVP